MVETILEEEAAKCEQDFAVSYNAVLASIREDRSGCSGARGFVLPDNQQRQEQKIIDIVDLLGGNECADEMLRLETLDEFRNLYVGLQQDLRQYKLDFVSAASMPDAAGSIDSATSKTGGWIDSDEERFLKVLKSHERKGGSAKKPDLLYNQLQTALPHVSVKDIKKHVKFHHHLCFYHEKCRDRQEFERKHVDVHGKAQEKLQATIRAEKEKQAQLDQLQSLQKNCKKLHERVAGWKISKEAKDRIAQQQQEIEQLMQMQRREKEDLQWRKRHDKQKRLVEDYKRSKLLDGIAGEKLSEEEMAQREAERAAQSLINAERVQYRQEEYQMRIFISWVEKYFCGIQISLNQPIDLDSMIRQCRLEEEKQKQLRRAHEEEIRVAKLNALKEETPYAQIIANIVVHTADPERTRQETAAFRANVEGAQEDLPVNVSVLDGTAACVGGSYDCGTLFKNARFKLGLALRNAGLHTTEYARQVLANVKVSNAGAYRHHVAQSTQLW